MSSRVTSFSGLLNRIPTHRSSNHSIIRRLHYLSSRVPRSKARNPARDVRAKGLVLRAECALQPRLSVQQHEDRARKPEPCAENDEPPIPEQERLTKNNSNTRHVHRVTHTPIETRHHKVLRRCNGRRRTQPLEGQARE